MTKIKSITVEGFKSISSPQSVIIKPLTVISGVNSAGKSSFMQSLLLIKQSLDAVHDTGNVKINGDNVKFNELSQIFSNIENKQSSEFSIKCDVEESNIDFESKKLTNINYSVKCIYGRSHDSSLSIQAVEIDDSKTNTPVVIKRKTKEIATSAMDRLGDLNILGMFYHIFSKYAKKNDDITERWSAVVRKCFINAEVKVGSESINSELNICSSINDFCAGMIHLPGLRGNPERMYERSVVFDSFPGRFERYTASIIFSWIGQKSKTRTLRRLEEYVALLGLSDRVDVRGIDDANLEIRVSKLPANKADRPDQETLVSIADVGFGVSQALPILVALLAAKQGQVVYIEQPEIHLHPRAQANLAKPFIDAAKRGVRVIVETHSSILLRALQTAVAKGELDHDDVSLNWFSRNQDGSTKITSESVDEFGAFGDWPVDFDDVYLDSESAYLDAVEQRYEKNN